MNDLSQARGSQAHEAGMPLTKITEITKFKGTKLTEETKEGAS